MAATRKAFIRTLEAAIEEHFEPIGRRYSWVTRSGELVWMIALDEDPGRPWFGFKPVRYAHRDWVASDMNNMACGAIIDRTAVIPVFDDSYALDYSAIPGPPIETFFDSGLPHRDRRSTPTSDPRFLDLATRKHDYELFFRNLKTNLGKFRTLEDMTNYMIQTRPGVTREAIEEFYQQRRQAMQTCNR